MISYQNFSQDWKGRAAYCATLAAGAIATFLSAYLIVQTVSVAQDIAMADDVNYGPSISVSGKGKAVASSTDIVATFSFGASATSESVPSAKDESAKIVNEVLAYLKSQGVDEKDTETQYYNLMPKEEWIPEPCPLGASYCPGGRYTPVGFTVDQTILVKVRDTDKAGDILSGVAEKNVTSISGLTFTIDEDEKLRDIARADAIADARERAKAIAADLGVELGEVIGMYESRGGYPMYESYDAYGGMSAPMAKAISPDIPVGEQEVEVTVDVQFEIEG
jgi:uncharacterized protein YggE